MNSFIEIQASGRRTRVAVFGVFGFSLYRPIRSVYQKAVVQSRPMVFDLRDTECIDAAGIAVLLRTRQILGEAGLEMDVVNASDRVGEILSLISAQR